MIERVSILMESIKSNIDLKLNALVISPSYWGYPEDKVEELLNRSVETLKKFNLNCNTTGPIVNFKEAKELRIKGSNSNYDFVVLLVTTWTEVADMFYLIKDFLNKPVLLWSHTMWYEKTKNEYHDLGAFASTGVIRKTL